MLSQPFHHQVFVQWVEPQPISAYRACSLQGGSQCVPGSPEEKEQESPTEEESKEVRAVTDKWAGLCLEWQALTSGHNAVH